MVFEMAGCGGCRTCEMACSFSHLGRFNADVSSLQILESPDGSGFKIRLVEEGEPGGRIPCDLCKGRETPLCLEYCHEEERLREILREFRARKGL